MPRAVTASPLGYREWVYRPEKHGLVYVSTYKSQPKCSFGKAKRPCCEREKKIRKPKPEVLDQEAVGHKGPRGEKFKMVKDLKR